MGVNTSDIEKVIEGKMMGLMKELAKLAPHPDRPEHQGPMFAQIASEHQPAAEYEGMLGSMIFESVLGTAFTSAASDTMGSWISNVDVSNVADAASEFVRDRAPASYTIGQRKSISGAFNSSVSKEKLMELFLRDLPHRLGLEKWLAYYQRKLYALRKQNRGIAPQMAA